MHIRSAESSFMFKQVTLIASVLALAALAACQTASPDVISRNDAQRMSTVQDATILSIRPVTIDGSQSGGGAAAGAVVGGVAGSNVGGPRGSAIVGVLGAIAGGVVGNAAERAATKEDAVEILVQMKGGERRSIVQGKGEEVLVAGDPVIITTTGGKVRVTKAPTIAVPAAPPAPVAQ
jgi:outer membrane lipoprotein SlyB